MKESKLARANERIAEHVVQGYKKIEDGVVDGYKRVERGAVDGFQKVSDAFVERFFTREGRAWRRPGPAWRENRHGGSRTGEQAGAARMPSPSAVLVKSG